MHSIYAWKTSEFLSLILYLLIYNRLMYFSSQQHHKVALFLPNSTQLHLTRDNLFQSVFMFYFTNTHNPAGFSRSLSLFILLHSFRFCFVFLFCFCLLVCLFVCLFSYFVAFLTAPYNKTNRVSLCNPD